MRRDVLDVPGQRRDEIVREVDDAGGFVLRGRLGRTTVDLALDLPLDGQRASKEVDVAELQASSLPQPQPGEGAHRIEGPELGRATAIACATCSGVGIRILVSALGTFGGVIATVGS